MQLHQIPMLKTWTIIGYDYRAETYCDGECVLIALGELPPDTPTPEGATFAELTAADRARADLRSHAFGTRDIEEALAVVAERRGIDRENERSYDWSEFPKVVLADAEFPELPRCAGCGGTLMGHDASDYADTEED